MQCKEAKLDSVHSSFELWRGNIRLLFSMAVIHCLRHPETVILERTGTSTPRFLPISISSSQFWCAATITLEETRVRRRHVRQRAVRLDDSNPADNCHMMADSVIFSFNTLLTFYYRPGKSKMRLTGIIWRIAELAQYTIEVATFQARFADISRSCRTLQPQLANCRQDHSVVSFAAQPEIVVSELTSRHRRHFREE